MPTAPARMEDAIPLPRSATDSATTMGAPRRASSTSGVGVQTCANVEMVKCGLAVRATVRLAWKGKHADFLNGRGQTWRTIAVFWPIGIDRWRASLPC